MNTHTIKSYHEHNKDKASEQIIDYMEDDKQIALVSDAGCPCISDQVMNLCNQVREADPCGNYSWTKCRYYSINDKWTTVI